MDFSKFDSRSATEKARRVVIRDQDTGEPVMSGDIECCMFLRGISSRSVQEAIRNDQAARMKSARNKAESTAAQTYADMHNEQIEAAARLITGFYGVQRPSDDGKLRDLTAAPEDIRWFLDLNFMSVPHLLRETAITRDSWESVADFTARKRAYLEEWHKPSFAQQALDAAQDDADFLHGTSNS